MRTAGAFAALAAVTVMSVPGCRGGATSGRPRTRAHGASAAPTRRHGPAVDRRVIAAHTDFAFRLFGEMVKEQPQANVVVSPTSVALALAMTWNGAAGETERAMAQTLGIAGLSADAVNRGNAALQAGLTNRDREMGLTIANSLWGAKWIVFSPGFLDVNRCFYGAQIQSIDFSSSQAAPTMNGWVAEATGGRIGGIVAAPINPEMRLILIDAVHFACFWLGEFDPTRTTDRPFTLLDSRRKTVPLMSQTGRYPYLKAPGLQAARLPFRIFSFGADLSEPVSLVVVLPDNAAGLPDVLRALTPAAWADWMARLQRREGTIKLPRFETACDAQLQSALRALGMGIAFDPDRADFTRSGAPRPTWIDEVHHKTMLHVDEEGVEAAAATEVALPGGAEMEGRQKPRPFTMVVDHPFLCAIWDEETQTILFVAAILDPGYCAAPTATATPPPSGSHRRTGIGTQPSRPG